MRLLTGATGSIGGALQHAFGRYFFDVAVARPRDVPSEARKTPCELAVLAHGPPPSASHGTMTWDKMLRGHVLASISLLEDLSMTPDGLVVLFTSIAAKKGSYDPSYAAAKGAVSALVPTYAEKLPCRVVGISPGLIEDSTIFEQMREEDRERHLGKMRAYVSLGDVASLVRLLILTPSIHNTIIEIDGGYRL